MSALHAVSLDQVLIRPDVWRGDRWSLGSAEIPAVGTGFAALDAELPGAGWGRGTLTEVLGEGAGFGECSLVLPALARLQSEGRWIMLVAPPHAVHAPAWAAHIDVSRLVIVAPEANRDLLWAAEQGLASGAPGALLCWAARIESAAVRRLQVAATAGTGLAFLFRPARAASEASSASLRVQVGAAPGGRLAVRVLKRRGPPCRNALQLDVPRPVTWRKTHELADLAGAASARTSARSASLPFLA